ncbi:MAG: NADH:ubiquinone reductase (Na(+)-transporting) subunit F, partial [Prevotella nanceiensis]|nr:NADH:ubiquinone reductase (Na(+)-transporting) subunit F [Hoylesella nanceiensis]
EWECTVISNKNVSSFIKEFIVELPPGEHMDFIPGSYAQIKIPAYDCIDYDKDFDKNDIGEEYVPVWENFNIFSLKAHNPEDTVRAYSMANYPAEGDRITLTVRIATTPFKPRPEVGFQDVPTGIASSYIFSRKPGDKVLMSGPYGDFHPIFNSKKEMIWVGGGAGMAPLRAQIMHMLKTLHTRDREMHYFYGARSLSEAFFLEDFHALEKEYPNFHFHLALDRPDPKADEAGVPYTAGFVHQVMYETYLKDHDAPEDIEYYMCGPGPMSKAVQDMLYSIGVEPESIMFDNFG